MGKRLLLIIAAITVLGAGWFVWQSRQGDAQIANNASKTSGSDASPAANTPLPQPKESVFSSGTFKYAPPKTGSGNVSLIKNADNTVTLRLEDDFLVQEGPALYVGFANGGTIAQETLFAELKAFKGKQEYTVPQSINLDSYDQVMIYCKEFAVPFSIATLN